MTYTKEYTRDLFEEEVKFGDTVRLADFDSQPESAWPTYEFAGYVDCLYQIQAALAVEAGSAGCHGCKGKFRLYSRRTRGYSVYCLTIHPKGSPAQVAIRWRRDYLPKELFEI